jgi:tRNA-2-methylthio-N6-dimethylallyladenosine synthase
MPDAAITTDIIVGFPGETDEDFEQTLDVVRRSRFAGAFTFQYSPRPGTPAATLPDQVPPEVVAERFGRLTEIVTESALTENQRQVGRTVELLVSAGEGRKDNSSGRLTGRARDGRLVHFAPQPAGAGAGAGATATATAAAAGVSGSIRPGDVVTVTVTRAAPHHLVADEGVLTHRRTRAGDRSLEGTALITPGVGLGMPSVGRPARSPEPVTACG